MPVSRVAPGKWVYILFKRCHVEKQHKKPLQRIRQHFEMWFFLDQLQRREYKKIIPIHGDHYSMRSV